MVVFQCELCKRVTGRDEVRIISYKDGELSLTRVVNQNHGDKHVCHPCLRKIVDEVKRDPIK